MDPYRIALQYAEVGAMLHQTGDLRCALEQYRECLSIQQSLLGKDHHETATTHLKIGCLLASMDGGDADHHHHDDNDDETDGTDDDYYDAACIELQKCYEIRKATFGKHHPETVECFDSIHAVMELALKKREKNLFHSQNQQERPILIHSSSSFHHNYGGGSTGTSTTATSRRSHHSSPMELWHHKKKMMTTAPPATPNAHQTVSSSGWNKKRNSRHQRGSIH